MEIDLALLAGGLGTEHAVKPDLLSRTGGVTPNASYWGYCSLCPSVELLKNGDRFTTLTFIVKSEAEGV
jgi:hypothetical protein